MQITTMKTQKSMRFYSTYLHMKSIKRIATMCMLTVMTVWSAQAQTPCADQAVACNNLVYVSLDTQCIAVITPDVVLESPLADPNDFDVRIYDPEGMIIPGDTIRDDYDGAHLKVEIECIASGIFCWGYLIVEDKIPPVVEVCPKDTAVSCFMFDFDFDPNNFLSKPPTFTDNGCEKPDSLLIRDFEFNYPCGDTIKLIQRIWYTFDAAGNEGRDTQCIYVLKGDLSDITFPPDTIIDCLDEGDLSPDKLGRPEIRSCTNFQVTYTEIVTPVCGVARKILRLWKVVDICMDMDTTATQVIEITDDHAPTMDFTNFEIPLDRIEADDKNCTASIIGIPNPVITDCNIAQTTLEIFYQLVDDEGDVIGVPVLADANPELSEPDADMTGQVIWDLNNVPLEEDFVVIFIANDGCGNISRDTSDVVRARDPLEPNAVCEGTTTVLLNDGGMTEIMAQTFDDHSFDNCEVVDYKVKRLDSHCPGFASDFDFGDKVHFCCDDIPNNPIRVKLRVFDEAGNYNDCIVEVIVKDTRPLDITCPDDLELDCDFDLDNLEDFLMNNAPVVEFGCGEQSLVPEIPEDLGLNECGQGWFTVTWVAQDLNGQVGTCLQHVTITNQDPPDVDRPPLNLNLTSCAGGTDPDDIPNSKPTVDDVDCENIAISHEDEVFPGAGINCLVIKREWTVIDWCLFNGGNTQTAILDQFTQTINLRDNTDPVFASCTDIDAIDQDKNCEEFISVVANATDDCTYAADLVYTYEIDLDDDGTVDDSGNTNDASGIYPVGQHSVRFTVTDECGNSSSCKIDIEITSQKEPVPFCHALYEAVIQNNGLAMVNASDLNWKSTRGCGGEDGLIFSFNAAGTQPSRTFSCQDIPNGVFTEIPVDLWVIDPLTNTTSSCVVVINLSDRNNDNCPNDSSLLNVAGFITDENELRVANIQVKAINISTQEEFVTETDENGEYSLSGLRAFGDYSVGPDLAGYDLTGLTTLDLVFIQRHILGLRDLDSPYKVLAADVNNSNSITAADLVDLRRLLLGKSSEIPNESWKFVKSDFTFTDAQDPWNYPDQVIFEELADSKNDQNFIGLKVGDVNNTAFAVLAQEFSGPRSSHALSIEEATEGSLVSYIVTSPSKKDIVGLQYAVEFDNDNLQFLGIQNGTMKVSGENYGLVGDKNNVVRFSWTSPGTEEIGEEAVMILRFKKITKDEPKGIQLRNDEEFSSEIYDTEYQISALNFENVSNLPSIENDRFTLAQNNPNPFGDITKIGFTLPASGHVTLDVIDVNGKRVYQNTGYFDAGQNEFILSTKNLNGSGIYYYSVTTESNKKTRRMIVLH